MTNKNIAILTSFLALALAMPVFAQTSTPAPSAAVIACVGAAVSVRETAIDAGIAAYTQAVQSAYSARASALQQAYTNTTTAAVRTAIKTAWTTFKTAMRSATKSWRLTRLDAWSKFRTAAKACRAPSSITDTSNSSSEATGQ